MNSRDNGAEEDPPKPFVEHLQDLRSALLRSMLALVAGVAVAIPLAPRVLEILKPPLAKAGKDPGTFLQVIEVTGAFRAAMMTTLLAGLVFSAPFITIFLLHFVSPALKRSEKRLLVRAGICAVILFAAGVCMCYFAILPFALKVMFGVADWMKLNVGFVKIADYAAFCLYLMLGFGLAFELPVALVVLSALGIVSSAMLARLRPYVLVLVLIVAAVLTPPDPFSQLMLAIPLMLLYEVSVAVIRTRERHAAEGGIED